MVDKEVRIGLLADHTGLLETLVDWYQREWEPYYGPGGPGDASRDVAACVKTDALPIGLVAFMGEELVGTAALKERSVTTHTHLTPWLAALLVAAEHRGRGVGTALIAAVEGLAAERGFERLYVGIGETSSLLTRRGWRFLERGPYFVSDVSIFCKHLGTDAEPRAETA